MEMAPTLSTAQAFHFNACSRTDRGLRRSRNEDVCAADVVRRSFMVADGMGGAAGGDVASALFLEAVVETFTTRNGITVDDAMNLVQSAFQLANSKILAHAASNRSHRGLGCTAEVLTFCRGSAILGHVGDSRTYRFHEGRLKQLTLDHSLVQEQITLGVISREQASTSRMRNILTRAVGIGTPLAIDISNYPACPGDIYLLCTDGLHGMLDDLEILSILAYDAPLSLKAEMFINMANDAGGKDNISVTLVEILE